MMRELFLRNMKASGVPSGRALFLVDAEGLPVGHQRSI